MQLTNKFGLPQTLVNAIQRDPYTKGGARISVTGLLTPPRIAHLRQKHFNDITEDVTDHIWRLFGRAIHKILEDGGDEQHLTEERLFAEVRGWAVSGQIDLQKLPGNPDGPQRVKITDYKSCSAYALRDEKVEWVQQLNLYKWLLESSKTYIVDGLAVCAFVKDWNRHKAKDDFDYPVAPAVMVNIPVWSPEEAAQFAEDRVRMHQEMLASTSMGDEPIHCTDTERWMRPTRYAVVKKGNKKPTRVYDDIGSAASFREGKGDDYMVETRPGEPIRCSGNYCQVAGWCKQYAEWEKANGR